MRTMRFFPWNESFIDSLPESEWQRIVEAESELDDLLDAFLKAHDLNEYFQLEGQPCFRAGQFFAAINSNPMPGHVKEMHINGKLTRYVMRKDMPQLALYHWTFFQRNKTVMQYDAEQAMVVAKKAYNKLLDEIARDNADPCEWCSRPDDLCTCGYCADCGQIEWECGCEEGYANDPYESDYDEPNDPYEVGVPVPVSGGTGVENE